MNILKINFNHSFSRLAANGDVEGLYAWYLAGADMEETGYDGRTPLQVVSVPCAMLHVEF